MHFSDVINELGNTTQFPIKPEKIAEIIKRGTDISLFVFIGVEADTNILRGKFARIRFEEIEDGPIPRPYAIPANKLIAKIYYARNQPDDWVRLTINKELLHVLDPDYVRTCTQEDARALASHLRLPIATLFAAKSSEQFNVQAFIDYISDFRAVVAMTPNSLRQLICDRYRAGKSTRQP